MTALAQTDLKKLVAYSSVAHMGFATLGIFALNKAGLEGAVRRTVEVVLAVSDLDEVGTATPLLDWCSLRHETQYTRLFRS